MNWPPVLGTGTRTEELAFLQDLELKTKTLLNTCSVSIGGQVDSFVKKLASRLNLVNFHQLLNSLPIQNPVLICCKTSKIWRSKVCSVCGEPGVEVLEFLKKMYQNQDHGL